jgi:hypothetical protein
MRKASTLVGLALIALGAGARAEDRAPATPTPAPPAAAVNPFPAAAPPAAATPAPAAASPVPAGTVGALASAAAYEAPRRRVELGLSFLPMGRGRITSPKGAMDVTGDASFAYGAGLSATYQVIAGLHLGLAPQVIYNVNYKVNPSGNGLALPPASTQYDIMARVEYEFPIVDTITLYAEALPGYSLIAISGASAAKGPILALGGGASMDMSDRIFLNMGVGYELGFQSLSFASMVRDYRTQYVRVALGVGARF